MLINLETLNDIHYFLEQNQLVYTYIFFKKKKAQMAYLLERVCLLSLQPS